MLQDRAHPERELLDLLQRLTRLAIQWRVPGQEQLGLGQQRPQRIGEGVTQVSGQVGFGHQFAPGNATMI